ncbi:helix-turn-helix transcriptional regulator [Facilibium subflavum]|uniref:helix-turn-helix transcriptional regulator n=1 Tax=Facilibium subflavum TaxID=2219058 RepID=UPI000E64837F|nr:LuxR C-terminal-related transcriptional regulator [Facilibium subflavum]
MPSFSEIHYHIWPKYSFFLEKLVREFVQKYYITEMTLSKYMPDGRVYDMTLYSGPITEQYIYDAVYLKEPLPTYHNLLLLPDFYSYDYLLSLNGISNNLNEYILYYNHISFDGSINHLMVITQEPEHKYLAFKEDFIRFLHYLDIELANQSFMNEFMIILPEAAPKMNIQTDFIKDKNMSVFKGLRLSNKEKKIVINIMNGITKIQDLAEILQISYRTCEAYVENIKHKLSRVSFYDLVIFVNKYRPFIKQLLGNS